MTNKIIVRARWWIDERLFAFLRGTQFAKTRNIWHLYQDLVWLGLASAASNYINIYAIRLGASERLLGLRTSLPSLIVVLLRVPAAQIIERTTNRKGLIVRSLFYGRLLYLLLFLLPWMSMLPLLRQIPQAQLMVWLVVLMGLPGVLSAAGWDSFFADIVPVNDRARVVSTRSTMTHLMTLTVVPLMGSFLEWIPFPYNYQIIFFLAFAGAMVSVWHVNKIRMPATARPPKRRATALTFQESRRILKESRGFSALVLATFVYQWAISIASPLFNIYYIQHLGASEGWIGLQTTIASIASIVAYRIWPRQVEKHGERLILTLAAPMMLFFPLLTGLSRSLPANLFIIIVPRLFGAGVMLARYNLLLRVCPDDRRPTYIAIYAILNSIAAFVAPLVGVEIERVIGISNVFFVSAALRLIAAMLYWRLPKSQEDVVFEASTAAPQRS